MDLHAIRNAIKTANDIETKLIEVPEWDLPMGVTELRGMTGAGKAEWLAAVEAAREAGNKYGHNPSLLRGTWFVVATGEPVLDDSVTDDEMNAKSAAVLERLASEALKLSEAAEGGDVKAPEASA